MTRDSEPALLGAVSRSCSAVHLQRQLPAPPERVWAAWTDPERLGRWLAPVEHGAPGPGATFVLRMAPMQTATCTVTRWEPPRLLELVWDYTGEGPSRLRLELSGIDGGTRLALKHDQLEQTDDPVDYGAGWHAHLETLSADLTGEPPPVFEDIFPRLHAAYAAQDATGQQEVRKL